MRWLGLLVFILWTLAAAGFGYSLHECPKEPLIVESSCPFQREIKTKTVEVPVKVIETRQVVSHEPRVTYSKPAITKNNPEVLFGYQGGHLETMIKIPAYDAFGIYAGYSTRGEYSVGVSFHF